MSCWDQGTRAITRSTCALQAAIPAADDSRKSIPRTPGAGPVREKKVGAMRACSQGTCAAHSIKLEPQAPRRFLPVASLDVAACLIGGYAEKVESVLGNCDNLWREKRRWAREGED